MNSLVNNEQICENSSFHFKLNCQQNNNGLIGIVVCFIDPSTLQGLWYFTGATTVAAAASYIFTKNTYQLIKQRKDRTKNS